MENRRSTVQPRRSTRREVEKPGDGASPSTSIKRTAKASQLDDQTENREIISSALKKTLKKTPIARSKTTVAKSRNGSQARGDIQSQDAITSSSSNKAHDSHRGRFVAESPHIASPSVHAGSQRTVNQLHASYLSGGVFQPGGGYMLLPFAFQMNYQTSQFRGQNSHTASNPVGPFSQPGSMHQPHGYILPSGQAHFGHPQSSQALRFESLASQVPVNVDSQALRSNPVASFVPMRNGQCGSWAFNTRTPMIPVPSYTSSLPRAQQQAIQVAASRAFGLANGWLPANLSSLNTAMGRLTNKQASDVLTTINRDRQARTTNNLIYSSNGQVGAPNHQTHTSNTLKDLRTRQEWIPNDDADMSSDASEETGSEDSYESFDMTPYSAQTCDGGRWFDPRFELATTFPLGNRLIAGINHPPNVLQQCNLTINPYGQPPRLVPHAPDLQRCNVHMNPGVVGANAGGLSTEFREENATRLPWMDPGPSQQRLDANLFRHASTVPPARYAASMFQPPQAHIPQRFFRATCDSHDCEKELRADYVSCARCHRVRYCDKFCQVFTWLVHLPTCNLHPEANANEVIALETWATEMWNNVANASNAAKDAEKDNEQNLMTDDELFDMFISIPTDESSASTSFETSDDVVMDNGDEDDQQSVKNGVSASQSTVPDDPGTMCDGVGDGQQDDLNSADVHQSSPSDGAAMSDGSE